MYSSAVTPELIAMIKQQVRLELKNEAVVNQSLSRNDSTGSTTTVVDESLRRNDSNGSTTSVASATSVGSATSVDPSLVTPPLQKKKQQRQCPPRPVKKRRLYDMYTDAEKQMSQDRTFLLRPVLTFFDAAFLAPKLSIMFKRKLCKTKNFDGPKVKKNADMDYDIFHACMKIVLRHILGEHFATAHETKARYILAAEKIVKKRRANHVQSWRPTKKGTHKNLRYGGTVGGMPPVEYMSAIEKAIVKGFLRNQKNMCNCLDLTAATATAAAAINPKESQPPPPQKQPEMQKPQPPPPQKQPEMQKPQPPPPKKQPHAAACELEAEFNPDFQCDDCGKHLDATEVFPKGQTDWASGITVTKCAACWNKEVQLKLVPEMVERQRKQNEGETRANENKPCKTCKCGSTFHKTTRHSDCPLNPRNLVQEQQPPKKKARKAKAASPKTQQQQKNTSSPKTPAASDSPESERAYKVGDRVDGFFGGWAGPRLLFAGQITKVHHDGTYDILYDDGDKETGVDPVFIQPEEPELPPPPKRARSDSPRPEGLPPAPAKPLGRQRAKKALLGRTFFDEGTVEDGKTIFQPGDFVVKKILDNGRLLCVRKSNIEESEEYLVGAVREMVVDYEKKQGIFE